MPEINIVTHTRHTCRDTYKERPLPAGVKSLSLTAGCIERRYRASGLEKLAKEFSSGRKKAEPYDGKHRKKASGLRACRIGERVLLSSKLNLLSFLV